MPPSSRPPWHLLESLFPPDRFLLSPLETGLYSSDAQPALSQSPAAVVFPQSADEVVQILRFCHQTGIPFVPRGSGTGLRGACCPPDASALVVVLLLMDRILSISPRQRAATVQPGVSPERLDREARLHGLRYRPNPGCLRSSTLGGNLALDAAGPNAYLLGNTASQLLGATLILPDGSVVECGGAPASGGMGPDPLHLLARSEGSLGIAVEMTLALDSIPEDVAMMTAAFPDWESALIAADAILCSGVQPAQLELFDSLSWRSMTAQTSRIAGYVLWCTLEGPAEENLEDAFRVNAQLQQCGAVQVERIPPTPDGEWLLQKRRGLFSSLGSVLVQDAAVPRSRLAEAVRFLHQVEIQEAVPISISLDAASGILYPCFQFDHRQPDSFRRAERGAVQFLLHCAESGGSIAAAHGLGREKRALFASVLPEEETAFQESLRAAFHPGASPSAAPSLGLFPRLPEEAVHSDPP